jgi:hypothetical protein
MDTIIPAILRDYGPWAALVSVFVWRFIVVDQRMAAALDRAEKRSEETTKALLQVIADNTRALDRASRALDDMRDYLPHQTESPHDERRQRDDGSSSYRHPSPARHFTPASLPLTRA